MTEREHWLAERRKGIGSSDAAAILGVHPYKSAYAVWAEKTGLIVEDSEQIGEAALWGNVLEPVIAEQYSLRTGRILKDYGRHFIQRNPTYPFALATIDREIQPLDERGPGILEIKTVGLRLAHLWEDEAPVYYQVQLQHQFLVTTLRWGSFAPLIGGQQLLPWPDEYPNERFLQILAEKEEEFWDRVKRRVPPPADGSESTRKTLNELYPKDSGTQVVLPGTAVEWDTELTQVKTQIKSLETRKTELENLFKAEIKEATKGVLPNEVVYTLKTTHKESHFVEGSTYRTLRRVNKAKSSLQKIA